MANELAIGLVIGASLKGVGSAFQAVSSGFQDLGKRLAIANVQQQRLGRAMSRGLADPQRNLGALSRRYQQLGETIRNAETAQRNLNKALAAQKAHTEKRRELQGKIAETGIHAMGLAQPITSAVKTYMSQEDAANNLKIAMMKADGTIGKFNEISKIADELGKDLPGTRTDFYNLARSLKKQGVSDEALTGGALKTAAQLNVLLDMDQEEGGEFLAKFMEARGLKESELEQAADFLQRGMYAGGLTKDQIYGSMSYNATTVRDLGLTGLENTKKLIALEGLSGQQGLEGTSFGTNFSAMLERFNTGPKMIAEAKKGMKAEARNMLEDVGVEFDFFDEKGDFKGIDAALKELTKFQKIKEKYGAEGAGLVAKELFGVEGARVAKVMMEQGEEGLAKFLKKMDEQASLQDRIAQKTSTLSAALESLGGVWESAVGNIGGIFAEDIKNAAKWLQTFLEEGLIPFIANNKGLIKGFVGLVAGFMGVKLAALSALYAFNLFANPFKSIPVLWQKSNAVFRAIQLARFGGAARSASWFGKTLSTIGSVSRSTFSLLGRGIRGIGSVFRFVSSGALRLGSALGGGLVKGITLAGKALMWLGRAMMANPIGLVIGAIALAAYLIYDNWSIIQPFFENLWSNVTQAFDNAKMWVQTKWDGVSQWFTDLWNNVPTYFSDLWTSIKTFFSDGIATLGNWISTFDPLSLFQTAFSAVLSWFGIDLPASFSGFGTSIVDSLVSGIMSAWETAKNTVMGLANSVKGWFTNALDINSPSKVFTGYGENIPQGLAIGIANKTIDAAERSKALGKKVGNAVDESVPTSSIGNIATAISQATLGIKNTVSQTKQQVSEAVKAKKEAFKSALKEQQNKKKAVGSAVKNSPTKGVGEGVKKAKAKSTGSALEKEKKSKKSVGDSIKKNKEKSVGSALEKEKKSKKSVGDSVKKNKEKGVGSALEKEQKAKRKKAEKQTQSEQDKRSKKGSSQPKSSALQNYQPLDREAVAGNNTNARGAITVNFSPNIHVGGECENPQNLKQQILDTLQNSLPELERLLNRVFDQRQRRAY